MTLSRRGFFILATGAALMVAPLPAVAADITAEQSALIYDLTAPLSDGKNAPGKPDAKILGDAVSILKKEGLAGSGGRPNFQESGILENYGKALFLGARAPEFAADIGHIRDIVSSGDRAALEQALTDLWVKAGRTRPDAKALAPVIASLYGAKGQEPEETVRHVIDRPDHRVEVAHARAGGLMQIDVTTKDKKGRETARTVLQGVTQTTPTPDGKQLQRHIKLDNVCTSTEKTDRATIGDLDGTWKDQSQGHGWAIARKGDIITLTEQRDALPPMVYTGTYRLGKIYAVHNVTAITDMGESLPVDVRQQLTTMNQTFRISLEVCAGDTDELRGTWSSQHVTYDAMTHSVSKIHDPYDLQMNLTRGGKETTKDGAASDELL